MAMASGKREAGALGAAGIERRRINELRGAGTGNQLFEPVHDARKPRLILVESPARDHPCRLRERGLVLPGAALFARQAEFTHELSKCLVVVLNDAVEFRGRATHRNAALLVHEFLELLRLGSLGKDGFQEL